MCRSKCLYVVFVVHDAFYVSVRFSSWLLSSIFSFAEQINIKKRYEKKTTLEQVAIHGDEHAKPAVPKMTK